MADHIGQQFGNYRLVQLLGQGGFADVYLAEHIHIGVQTALKVLSMRLTNENVGLFRTEARTLAHLVHPSIVRILDFGIENNIPYLVMDYAPYGSLRTLYPKGTRLSLPIIVDYVKQVAEALQHAHDRKFIHRDIKPENILVGRRRELLVSDFGIALIAQSSRYQGTQDMAGTILYMAPEQIQGKPRPASDQYALGIIIYEWLSGECPFHGTFNEIAIQHATISPPPLREKVPMIPPAIEQVVMTALAKEPKKRFTSIKAFAAALEQASHSTQTIIAGSLPTKPATSPTSQPSQLSDLNVLYKESVKARSQGDLERTALLWQQILDRDPQFQLGTLTLQMQKLLEELAPWRVKRLRDVAERAHASGEWGQEIIYWQNLLRLEPNNDEVKARIALAERHQKYAWMYEITFQFVQEQALSEAATQLEMLWREDPEYGDPAGLAQKVGINLIEAVPRLYVEEGKEPGRVYEIRKESLSIGRSRESDIFLEDLALSRLHASVINMGNGLYALKDEGSANGTKVNGQLVSKYQTYPLQRGDKIQFGQTVLGFQMPLGVQWTVSQICPQCQFQVANDLPFCSRCGYMPRFNL